MALSSPAHDDVQNALYRRAISKPTNSSDRTADELSQLSITLAGAALILADVFERLSERKRS